MRFLNKSWAPKATATENKPRPATKGPICMPKMSKIMPSPIIQIIILAALSSHIVMERVSTALEVNA